MASEQEIIRTIEDAPRSSIKIRVLDQLGHKIKPQHRELIRFLVKLASQEQDQEVAYSVKRALFRLRSRYNITNFTLFLMDPSRLLQSSDPAYRLKALDVFEGPDLNLEHCTAFLGSLHFEDDPFVLSKMIKVLPRLSSHLPLKKIEVLLGGFLEHPDSRVRSDAVEAMGEVRLELESQNLEMLWNCLKDPDQRVRSNAQSQLKAEDKDAVKDVLHDRVGVSENYYELQSCLELFQALEIELPAAEVARVKSLMETLERDLHLSATEPGGPLDLGVGGPERGTQGTFGFIGPRPWLYLALVALVFLGFSLKLSSLKNKWKTKAETLQVQLAGQLEELEKVKKDLKAKTEDTLIARRDLAFKVKLSRFQNLGKRLRQNADVFMKQAREGFEKEEYDQTIETYKAIYQVYKDNRLAVDAVRWLSRTQKIQNILASVKDYLSKGQVISAQRKLEELRHLVSKDVYLIHKEEIELKSKERD